MAKYKLTNKAVEDLMRIWDYTFERIKDELFGLKTTGT
jgi:hypothetical protein